MSNETKVSSASIPQETKPKQSINPMWIIQMILIVLFVLCDNFVLYNIMSTSQEHVITQNCNVLRIEASQKSLLIGFLMVHLTLTFTIACLFSLFKSPHWSISLRKTVKGGKHGNQ